VHEECMRPEAATGRDYCTVCGADLQAARDGKRQPGRPRGGDSSGSPSRRMSKLIGVMFLVLAVTCVIPAIPVALNAPDVSYLVGALLPSLVCAIIGLWFLR